MIRCPQCGTENEPGNRFCFNCGTPLVADGAAAVPPPMSVPPSPAPQAEPTPAAAEWRAVPVPPAPPRRRIWLWIVLGLLGACVLCCVGGIAWGATIGHGDLQRLGTWAAERATEAVRTPTP